MSTIKCKWCKAKDVNGKATVQFMKFGRWLCAGCGAMGYIKEPTSEELVKIYEKAWKDSNDSGRFAAGTTSKRIAKSLISLFCGDLVRGTCLDYGGGHGEFAKALLGCKVESVCVLEPFGPKQNIQGLDWVSSWSELPPERKFDWIFMLEVIEHLLDPVKELSKIRRRLTFGGKLAITTPNTRGWRSIKEGPKWLEVRNPAHINLFSPLAIKSCLQQSGFHHIQRLYKPVSYQDKKIYNYFLALTQVIGIDGSIKILANR